MIVLADGSEVEASLDRGRIVCGTSALPLCELELELKAGAPLALFDFADTLLAECPVRPAYRSKAERGYLLAGLDFPPAKGRRFALPADADVPAAVALFVASGLEQLHANEDGMLVGNDIEYLHQMRVGVRRLRSCLSAFGAALPKPEVDALRAEMRWLGSRLGAARDWDVFMEAFLPVLIDGLAGVATAEDLTALVQGAHACKARSARGARTALNSRRSSAMLIALGRVAAGGGMLADAATARQPLTDYGPRLLERRLESVRRRGRKSRRNGTVAQLHALRIAVKKLRYAVEFVGEALAERERVGRYRRVLVRLQNCLGRICDAAVMADRVAEAAPERTALVASVRGWSACAIHAERRRLRSLWRDFRKTDRFW
jgi:inorganic triphosphatase YgiF